MYICPYIYVCIHISTTTWQHILKKLKNGKCHGYVHWYSFQTHPIRPEYESILSREIALLRIFCCNRNDHLVNFGLWRGGGEEKGMAAAAAKFLIHEFVNTANFSSKTSLKWKIMKR